VGEDPILQISAVTLGHALVARLNDELPDGCWLECGTSELWGGAVLYMHTDEGSWGGTGIGTPEDPFDEVDLPAVVEAALSAVQDDVAYATQGLAWPYHDNASEPLPPSWAKLAQGVLTFGYGSKSLGGIPLTELAG